MSPITPGEILPHFDVRAASVGGKLAILIFCSLEPFELLKQAVAELCLLSC